MNDPYWPKWDGPWWTMDLLWEMDRAREIDPAAVDELLACVRRQIKPYFCSWEGPEKIDIYRDVICHCGWGTLYQMLRAAGVDVEKELPQVRPWFLKYQLPDGGLNCEEEAYRGSRKSSIVSTVPCLEAVLGSPGLTKAEEEFLDRGAEYLLKRRLVHSSNGKLLNEAWLKPYFPRFYDYDELRGLTFLVKWSRRRGIPLPKEAREALERQRNPGPPGRPEWLNLRTLRFVDGQWVKQDRALVTPLVEQALREAPEHLARIRKDLLS